MNYLLSIDNLGISRHALSASRFVLFLILSSCVLRPWTRKRKSSQKKQRKEGFGGVNGRQAALQCGSITAHSPRYKTGDGANQRILFPFLSLVLVRSLSLFGIVSWLPNHRPVLFFSFFFTTASGGVGAVIGIFSPVSLFVSVDWGWTFGRASRGLSGILVRDGLREIRVCLTQRRLSFPLGKKLFYISFTSQFSWVGDSICWKFGIFFF